MQKNSITQASSIKSQIRFHVDKQMKHFLSPSQSSFEGKSIARKMPFFEIEACYQGFSAKDERMKKLN